MNTITLTHNKISLALHLIQEGSGSSLLLAHGLGESSPDTVPPVAASWTGPVWALDFTGHGASTVPMGGGYTCEGLASDIDVALAHTGPSAIFGRGLGGYVALLTAGGRPELVQGLIIADGPGLAGGSTGPSSATWIDPAEYGMAPDPFALAELSTDVRPPDYATSFARLLLTQSPLEVPLVVAARNRTAWLDAVASEPGVISEPLIEALARYR